MDRRITLAGVAITWLQCTIHASYGPVSFLHSKASLSSFPPSFFPLVIYLTLLLLLLFILQNFKLRIGAFPLQANPDSCWPWGLKSEQLVSNEAFFAGARVTTLVPDSCRSTQSLVGHPQPGDRIKCQIKRLWEEKYS